jgi:hypothetical protein
VMAERTTSRNITVKNPARLVAYGKTDKVFRTVRNKQNDRKAYR